MIKYISLDAVQNYLPAIIQQDVDTMRVRSWCLQAYRDYELPFTEELSTVLLNVRNHRARLPKDLKRITGIRFSAQPFEDNDGITNLIASFGEDPEECRLIIYQEIFFGSVYWKQAKPLAYKGQMRSAIIDESLYCSDCEIGFSVDKHLSCLTIDIGDGEITLVYFKSVMEGDAYLVPDDPALMEGLSWWVQAKYWLEKAYAHEDSAYTFHNDALAKATTALAKFRGKRLLRGVNVAKHRSLIFDRNRPAINYNRNY